MRHATGTRTGLNNTHLFTQHWQPDGIPQAVIVLVHGLAEHSGRYTHVAAHLVAQGYAVHALDHRGHGQSDGDRLAMPRFDDYVDDLRAYVNTVQAQHPGLPLVLYGHSMGALIALLFAIRWQDDLAGLIVSGVPLRLGGVNAPLKALVGMLYGARLRAMPLPALDAAGVSRDPAVVAAYENDPLVCRQNLTVQIAAQMMRAAQVAERGLPDLRLPVLALHGSKDPLCLPVGAEIVRQRCGSPDCTVTVYEGLFHEVHNEPEQDRVLADITGWLVERIKLG